MHDRADDIAEENLGEVAATEVDRILASRSVGEILDKGSQKEQRRAFHRIARLLHPENGLVSKDDRRASLALRLAFAASKELPDHHLHPELSRLLLTNEGSNCAADEGKCSADSKLLSIGNTISESILGFWDGLVHDKTD